jgi:hypothetical protein
MADLEAALDVFYAGDAAALERLLRADPSLLHARVTSAEGPYCGYFHEATLLHHVAGNPFIRPLPAATTELARLVLERGADRTVRDTSFKATPQGWAEHAGHQAVAALVAP